MQVQSLEDYLRVPLFRRNGRQVELTAAGALLRPRVEQALADLEAAIDEARADLVGRGIDVSEVQRFPWGSFVFFSDPDGNGWAVQELPSR
jgi:hypothetical protein